MTDVIALKLALDSSATEQLTALGVNCLKSMPSLGPAVWGARTLSNNSVYRYISARRTVLSVKRALRRTLAWAVFEPNTPELKKTIVGSVTAYLNGLFRSGVLAGTKPEEAFVVQAENMDDNLIIDIGLALLIPTEFVVIRLRHTNETIEVYS
jgi:phage tail sheath protein FI